MENFILSLVKLFIGIIFLLVSILLMVSIFTAIWNFNDFIDNSSVVEAKITNIDFSHEDCLDPGESDKSGIFQGPFPCLKFYNVKYEFFLHENQKYYGNSEMNESEIEKLPKQNLPSKAFVEYLPKNPKINKLYGTKAKTIFQLILSSNSDASLLNIAFSAIFLCSSILLLINVWKNRIFLKIFGKVDRS